MFEIISTTLAGVVASLASVAIGFFIGRNNGRQWRLSIDQELINRLQRTIEDRSMADLRAESAAKDVYPGDDWYADSQSKAMEYGETLLERLSSGNGSR